MENYTSHAFAMAVRSIVNNMNIGVNTTDYNNFVNQTNTSISNLTTNVTTAQGRADDAYNLANATSLKLPIQKYADISGSISIGSTWVEMVNLTLTTDISATPILIWGNLNISDNSTGSTVECRIHVNTPTSQYSQIITTDLPNNKSSTFPILFRAIGPTPPGPVLIQIDAQCTHGSALRKHAELIVLANPKNA